MNRSTFFHAFVHWYSALSSPVEYIAVFQTYNYSPDLSCDQFKELSRTSFAWFEMTQVTESCRPIDVV